MSADSLFQLVSAVILPAWALLIFAPRWTGPFWIAQFVVPAGLGIVYIAVVLYVIPNWKGGFASLEDVERLFENRWMLLAGWTHYLAFDLFIGSWQVRDSQRHNIPHGLVVPCLILTLMIGPTGLVAYLCLRQKFLGCISMKHS